MELWAGRLLVFVAATHLLLAIIGIVPHMGSLAPDGLLGAVDPPWNPQHPDRQAAEPDHLPEMRRQLHIAIPGITGPHRPAERDAVEADGGHRHWLDSDRPVVHLE